MMAPTLVFDREGSNAGARRGGRDEASEARSCRSSAAMLDDGLSARDAVDRPRLHPAAGVVHLEPGFAEDVLEALEAGGFTVRHWPSRHHYFGGVSAVSRSGAAGDPRRSGSARHPP